jgi:hypothetical protein
MVPHPDSTKLETRIAIPCKICGSWLVHTKSIAAHMGPVCARRLRAKKHAAINVPLPFDIPGQQETPAEHAS